jgi:tetratricopeptide (TPR) repeat protein
VVLCEAQIQYWRNSETLFRHALAKSGHMPEAIAHYQADLQTLPDSPITHNDLANALVATPENMPEAIAEYQIALRLKPDYEEARNNLAELQSHAAETQYNRGVDLARSGNAKAAIPYFEGAVRLQPDYIDAHNNLGVVLASGGQLQEAIPQFEAALRIDPNSSETHVTLGLQARSRDPADAQPSRKTKIATGGMSGGGCISRNARR